MDLHATKESKEIGWLEKAAEEVDIMLDEFEAHNELDDDEDGGRSSRKGDVAAQMKLIKLKKKELSKLLQTEIFPRGFSYRYPTATGELSVPGMSAKETAVTVMREAMDKDKDLTVLKGKNLKKRQGKSNKPKVPANNDKSKETKGGKVNNSKGVHGKPSTAADTTASQDQPKSKSGTKYYMPQPKTSTKPKNKKYGKKKAPVKPTKV